MSTATVHAPAGFRSSDFGVSVRRVHLRLTRRGRAVLIALASVPLVVGLIFMVNAGGAAATGSGAQTHFDYVTVQAGQSLWSIAEKVAPNADPREVIADIVSLNQLEGGIVSPGERIAIPEQYEGAAH
jgi:hypothetical protein